jgi:hypothetical protein
MIGEPLMSDLRTRIEAILWANWEETAPSGSFVEMADAVIRELGNLRQEPHRFQCGSDGCSRYRIISDWTTDE